MGAIDSRRIHVRGESAPIQGEYVLYWMQSAVRAHYNHALEHAAELANELGRPLLVWSCLIPDYPAATSLHHSFFAEGLIDAAESLHTRGIPVIIGKGDPVKAIEGVLQAACILVTDDKPLRHHKDWVEQVCSMAPCPVHVVETNVMVPLDVALGKEAYSAASLRPHIMPLVPEFALATPTVALNFAVPELAHSYDSHRVEVSADTARVLPKGGHSHAIAAMRLFLTHGLFGYADCGGSPAGACTSRLSPYLHFGHLSPCELYSAVSADAGLGRDAFIEQFVVRRELSYNFVHYNAKYDSIDCLPQWAHATLNLHGHDPRDYLYAYKELVACATHDPYWNAAQRQMMETGYMDGYMRMYWGKKVIEWSERPEDAYSALLELNNLYELDGRDPNGYAGVAWCFGKHDRPWKERKIFGMVRYMNDKGLLRKFDMDPYLAQYGK